jgi:hypothetical protein
MLSDCAVAPDVGGIANVAGVVWQSDTTPLAHASVIFECVGARVFDTTETDEAGHYTISLYSGFSAATPDCSCYAPSVQHPVAIGGSVIYFSPSNEPHPVQIIDLAPDTRQ